MNADKCFDKRSEISISGHGVKVSFENTQNLITLYHVEGSQSTQVSKAAPIGCPIVNGQIVDDFVDYECTVEKISSGVLGEGERMTISSISHSRGLTRIYTLETSYTKAGLLYSKTAYRAEKKDIDIEQFIGNAFELADPAETIWSYNGGGEGQMHYYDTLQEIDLTTSKKFSRENIQDHTAASIPLADIYSVNGGIGVGDASATRREVHTPVMETDDSAEVSIKWPGKSISAGNTVEVGQSFVVVHKGDYYNGLRGYKNGMECLGVVMQSNIADRSYDLRWESWGWAESWTIELILGELDRLEAAGVKQITLDDSWYDSAGDWQLKPEKFPNGVADARRLTDAIHAHGMSAILWWRPCDGGRANSKLYQEHPEYFIQNADGSTAALSVPGIADHSYFSGDMGYALCPASEGAIASQVDFINRAMNEWGFDGFKGDFVWSMAKCYNPAHNHAYPEESTEKQADFYRAAWKAMVHNDPDGFNLLCNCGTPQDYYSLPYMTQVITADPTSLDQTRRRVKAYKALMGDDFPITTDHSLICYPSTIGTGSVLIEKRAFIGSDWDEYKKWLDIANRVQLHKGTFIGDLYSYGFDPYETYVVRKNGTMYYAFYRDGIKYAPKGYPAIELRGLDPNKMYRIVDYINDRVVATNLMGNAATFHLRFQAYLLVKAVEITEPDVDLVDPDWGFTSIDAMDTSLVYEGDWHDDRSDKGNTRYTLSEGASVELTFCGTAIRWYGQHGPNLGAAIVYIDGVQTAEVNLYGNTETGLMLFEAFDLPAAVHTVKIACQTPGISLDRLAYEYAPPETVYEKVDARSERIKYCGDWAESHDDFLGDTVITTKEESSAELSFYGTAIRWYGYNCFMGYGAADVFIDGEFIETAYSFGPEEPEQLIFSRAGLPEGEHTIKLVYHKGTLNLDHFAYATE